MIHKIAVIGLGYVGMPLARLFSAKYQVTGFDTDTKRIEELKQGIDKTLELKKEDIQTCLCTDTNPSSGLSFSTDTKDIADCNTYIITVPTPVDPNKNPDLRHLQQASRMIAGVLKKNDIVIYESTVYPGATEEECVPLLEKGSSLKYNTDFFVGYSPERINPGDPERKVENILKITAGSNPEAAKVIDNLYKSVIKAGTYLAPSIKIAEAAKAIENAQRDINIAFINELAKIFNLMEIDTQEVLKAARTKWNFLHFSPGLVGGHCTGVDPYYLAHKALKFGYYPEIILAARKTNDSMGHYIAGEIIKKLLNNGACLKDTEILVLGFTFKENCTDIRNTRVIDLVNNLKEFGSAVTTVDPWADPAEVEREYGISVLSKIPRRKYKAVVLAVSHNDFMEMDLSSYLAEGGFIYDVKGVLPKGENVHRL